MRALVAAAMVAGCWTGSTPAETPINTSVETHESGPALRVRLERTGCLGKCPVYAIEIDGRAHVATFEGMADVPVIGMRSARLSDEQIARIERAVDRVRFFERDARGVLPAQPACTSDGTTTTCTLSSSIAFCSDSPTAIISVRRGRLSHRIEQELCGSSDELAELRQALTRIASMHHWIDDE